MSVLLVFILYVKLFQKNLFDTSFIYIFYDYFNNSISDISIDSVYFDNC